jgi:two-component system alkaline phosphatase synthesis response regulator PhoP
MALASAGFRVFDADNGASALPILEAEHCSVVVLDMAMPVMDGRSLFHRMEIAGDRPAVVIVSADNAHASQKELGAEAALSKPFDPDALVDMVTTLAN